jgi:hypothetical protein
LLAGGQRGAVLEPPFHLDRVRVGRRRLGGLCFVPLASAASALAASARAPRAVNVAGLVPAAVQEQIVQHEDGVRGGGAGQDALGP